LEKLEWTELQLRSNVYLRVIEFCLPSLLLHPKQDTVLEIDRMAKKIYVGNLSFNATEDEVRELFAAYGEVTSVAMITDRDTGRFRGFSFVEMADAGADAAIQALDGKDLDGRSLRVNEARPREDSGGGNRGGGNRGGGNRGGGSRGGNDRW
jgi:RNA recognition motif-containing protein